jgi:RND family efflux transporter MFP subunit
MFKRSRSALAALVLGLLVPATGSAAPPDGSLDFTGRVEAVQSVELRARVTGYLAKVAFKEGSKVEKGQLLFEIDDRPYKFSLDSAKAALEVAKFSLDSAKASLEIAQASFVKTKADYEIGLNVQKDNPGAISQQEIIKRLGARDEAQGSINKAKASIEEAKSAIAKAEANLLNAQLNYDWCKVRAPISGRIGRAFLTPGNLVRADETRLASLAATDPVYVYFDVDEKTFLRLRQQLAGREKGARVPLHMGLAGEKDYPHEGALDMVGNRVDPKTGALRMRGVFPNKDGTLVPGMFARVRMDLGKR